MKKAEPKVKIEAIKDIGTYWKSGIIHEVDKVKADILVKKGFAKYANPKPKADNKPKAAEKPKTETKLEEKPEANKKKDK